MGIDELLREKRQRIEEYVADGRQAFMALMVIQEAVMRNLQTLAESTIRLSNALKTANPGVDWRAIRGIHNVAVHD